MRILLVTGSYPPMKCGIGAYTQKLAQALARRSDCDVMVLTGTDAWSGADDSAVELHAEVHDWRFRHIWGLIRMVRALRPDVVHFQFPTQGYDGCAAVLLPMALCLMRVPTVQTWHEPPVQAQNAWLLALGLDSLIAVKQEIKRHLTPGVNRLLRKKGFTWIPGASMLPNVTLSAAERERAKAGYGMSGEWLLVFYGFVAPLKGLETLFELVARTLSRLVLACDIRAGEPYHQSLMRLIEELKIGDRVQILGFQPEHKLATLLAVADAAVFPFVAGAAPWNTSIDGAVAQGVFVLTTAQGASDYDESRHVFYAQPGAVEEMVQALHQYAGTRVAAKPSLDAWDKIANAHNTVYRDLMAT